jgi:hypothetical protein
VTAMKIRKVVAEILSFQRGWTEVFLFSLIGAAACIVYD